LSPMLLRDWSYVIALLISRALVRAQKNFCPADESPAWPRGQVASNVNGAIGFRLFRKIWARRSPRVALRPVWTGPLNYRLKKGIVELPNKERYFARYFELVRSVWKCFYIKTLFRRKDHRQNP
jgi:hypothetical protein